jgi:hypothetical protein
VTASAAAALDRNHRDYRTLVAQLQSALARHRWPEASARAQQVGAFAWRNHTGLFASAEVESALQEMRQVIRTAPRSSAEPIEVLHVVSQTYATGGPTQAISQWVARDTTRRHYVCLTQQGAAPLPDKVLRSTAGGRHLIDLTRVRGGLLERASELRSLVERASLVVVHSHPHDVVPALAIPAECAGVMSINHADHVFWVGTSVPGLHVSMRESGRALSLSRRAIDPCRSDILPRPLAMLTRRRSRSEARRGLGLAEDAVLVVTAADAPKYCPVDGPSLLEMVLPVFLANPRAVLLAAGPAPLDEWRLAEERTGGRVRALGRLPDVTEMHEAADVYLDSFPFSSLTSLLEAARLGTPVVTFRGHPEGCEVLGADTPGIDEHIRAPRTADALRDALEDLLANPAVRADEGARLADAVASTHDGPAWLTVVDRLYARAGTTAGAGDPAAPPPRLSGDLDRLVALVQAKTPLTPGVAGAARFTLPYLPPASRIRSWAATGMTRSPASPSLLLSPRHLAWFVRRRRSLGLTRASVNRLVPGRVASR